MLEFWIVTEDGIEVNGPYENLSDAEYDLDEYQLDWTQKLTIINSNDII